MNIQSSAKPNTQKTSFASKIPVGKVAEFAQEKPFRTIMDVADIGITTPLALGASFGPEAGNQFFKGAGFVLGAAHGVSALFNFVNAIGSADSGYKSDAKQYALVGIGDALAATGAIAAAAGVGPVAIPFALGGAVISSLAA